MIRLAVRPGQRCHAGRRLGLWRRDRRRRGPALSRRVWRLSWSAVSRVAGKRGLALCGRCVSKQAASKFRIVFPHAEAIALLFLCASLQAEPNPKAGVAQRCIHHRRDDIGTRPSIDRHGANWEVCVDDHLSFAARQVSPPFDRHILVLISNGAHHSTPLWSRRGHRRSCDGEWRDAEWGRSDETRLSSIENGVCTHFQRVRIREVARPPDGPIRSGSIGLLEDRVRVKAAGAVADNTIVAVHQNNSGQPSECSLNPGRAGRAPAGRRRVDRPGPQKCANATRLGDNRETLREGCAHQTRPVLREHRRSGRQQR